MKTTFFLKVYVKICRVLGFSLPKFLENRLTSSDLSNAIGMLKLTITPSEVITSAFLTSIIAALATAAFAAANGYNSVSCTLLAGLTFFAVYKAYAGYLPVKSKELRFKLQKSLYAFMIGFLLTKSVVKHPPLAVSNVFSSRFARPLKKHLISILYRARCGLPSASSFRFPGFDLGLPASLERLDGDDVITYELRTLSSHALSMAIEKIELMGTLALMLAFFAPLPLSLLVLLYAGYEFSALATLLTLYIVFLLIFLSLVGGVIG